MKIGNLEIYGIIYKITNLVNGKVYIGQTTDKKGFDGRYSNKGEGIERVYNCNDYYKQHNIHYNKHLYNSIEKYGFNNFVVNKIFDIAFSKEELDIKEDLWINYFDCIKNGYNNQSGGSNGKPSEETKKKISLAITGTRQGKNNTMYGIEPWNKGQSLSEEIKKHISNAKKGKKKGDDNPFYGIHGFNNPNSKNIICITTNIIFANAKEAGIYYNIDNSGIAKVCKGKRKTINYFIFKYIEDLTEEEYIKYDIKNRFKKLELSDEDSPFLI